MTWSKVTVTSTKTTFTKNYKRQIAVHSHPLQNQFIQDALATALTTINANLPVGQAALVLPDLKTSNVGQQLGNDPGANYSQI